LTIDFAKRTINILTLEGRIRLPIFVPKYFEQYLTWKRCSADLFQVKGKTFLHIVFEKETEDVSPSRKMVGIDRGIRKLATVSDNRFFNGGRIKQLSERYERLRGQLQSKKSVPQKDTWLKSVEANGLCGMLVEISYSNIWTLQAIQIGQLSICLTAA
jgi:hypothetical protein